MTVSEARAPDVSDIEPGRAIQAFSELARNWELSTDDQIKLLGSPPRSTFFKWKKQGGSLPPDTTERISHLVNIHKALEILFTDPKASDGWLHRENTYFNGSTALDVMLGGHVADIIRVRQYLDAQRGG